MHNPCVFAGDQNTPICGPGKLECQKKTEGDFDFYIHADTHVYRGVFQNTVLCHWTSGSFCFTACTDFIFKD